VKIPESLHGFFMEFADWLMLPPSRNHPPRLLWITICTIFPVAVLLQLARTQSGTWIGLIAGILGFGAAIVFFAVFILAIISRIYSSINRKQKNRE